ncbi:malic enzyme-like NAD(P)-binding protein [Spirochaeta cellobiosiphila]|uniref:malic enzyme-like NAD(P)-binding protein n=1 Tax=Spirochaeta cellobiosiphila TaxID=504483 RepID=UPI00048DB64E|nr:malic enzyme-like NAD(P)-binding protein [Spirochaeta cellobiosiphila]
MASDKNALDYHRYPTPGKISVVPTKECSSAEDLALAYSPGVAQPVLAIAEEENQIYNYTAKGNLVGVISNGTAILGLGNRGAAASKPVMEGKGVLFKKFAGIDVFDIELDTTDPQAFIQAVSLMEPTFGGINLEDIKAPECFEIETKLKEIMNIPVFHDDQHGTAIISAAGFLNALEVTGKKLDQVKIVFSGAGAAGLSCVKMLATLGVPKENIIMCDIIGVVYKGRTEEMFPEKAQWASDSPARTMEEAILGADVFFGLSAPNILTPAMLKSMAPQPIVFAMANPDPEITYPLAKETRPDIIMATGRSDYPNQINNVLGFPFIFRGALDVRATSITENMKMAAAKALAALAKEPVPEDVIKAYGGEDFSFGPNYIVPKPFDKRVFIEESLAVAKAACEEGIAQKPIKDWAGYRKHLEELSKTL